MLLQSCSCTDGQPLADTPQPALLEAPPTRRSGGVGLDIHSAAGTNALAPVAARAKPLVYVPNSRSAGVSVIDPATYTVIRTFATGAVPQHVVAAHDLDRLWVLDNEAGTLTPIDPATGQEGGPIHVDDPYNMYFTPVVGSHVESAGEHRGGTIEGGTSRLLAAGVLMMIPAGVAHQYRIAADESLRYLSIKVLDHKSR